MMRRKRSLGRVLGFLLPLGLVALLLLGCPPGGGTDDGGNGDVGNGDNGGDGDVVDATLNTRVEVSTLDGAQIDALRAGVALMQSRDVLDPTSWLYQANIHGVPGAGANCPQSTVPVQEAWATCQHGSFFFLAWHRMYLFYFEDILRSAIREAISDPNYEFALPYWDYDGGSATLPQPFIDPADASNSLWISERTASCNGAGGCVSPSQGSAAAALGTVPVCNCPPSDPGCQGCLAGLLPDETFHGQFTPDPVHFLGQFGELESQPHNTIHNLVGGWSGYMSDPDCAARDPIFWFHHANIDRLWQVWLNQNAGRVNPLGSDDWKTQLFTFFDASGAAVQKTGCEVLNMATQLDYEYAGLPVENVVLCTEGDTPAPPPVEAGLQLPNVIQELATSDGSDFTLGSRAVEVTLPMSAEIGGQAAGLSSGGPGSVRLVLEGLEILGEGGVYDLYVNLPEGAEPNPDSPHFVGHVTLFGHLGHGTDGEHEGSDISRSFEVGDEIAELVAAGEWDGDVRLTLVPSTPDTPEARLRFRRAALITRGGS